MGSMPLAALTCRAVGRSSLARPIVLALLLVGGYGTPLAANTFSGLLITNACGTRTETSAIGQTQHDSAVVGGLNCDSTATNEASPGRLRIIADSAVDGRGSSNAQTTVRAYLSVDDLVITGPGPTASGVMYVQLDSILDLSVVLGGDQNAANSSADWLLNFNSTWGQGEARRRIGKSIGGGTVFDQPTTYSSSGVLTGYMGGPTTLALTYTNVPTNRPISFFMTIFGQSRAQAGGCVVNCPGSWMAQASAVADASRTLSLMPTGPTFVFNDPGYFANSIGLQVVDNVWIGAPIPEPATVVLWLAGLIGLAGKGRRAFA